MLGNVEEKIAQAKSQGIAQGSHDQLSTLSHRFSTSGKLFDVGELITIHALPSKDARQKEGALILSNIIFISLGMDSLSTNRRFYFLIH